MTRIKERPSRHMVIDILYDDKPKEINDIY